MPLRGGGGMPPDIQQFQQLGQMGQQAAPQVPGLLQMAQAAMDGGGGRGGGPSFSENDIPFGAEVRPITSPEDQNWSDAQGRPIHVGGKPPAYNPGTTAGGFNAVFDPRAPSANGGYFTLDDYFAGAPAGTSPLVPGSRWNGLSTNNWRLLPQGFNTPDYFMINGTIVSRAEAGRQLAPKSVLGQEGGGPQGYARVKGGPGGIWSEQVGSQGAREGFAGSNIWSNTATPTY